MSVRLQLREFDSHQNGGSVVNRSYAKWDSLAGPGQLFVLLLCFCIPWQWVAADDWHFSDVKRIVAVSDIHGAYAPLVATLQAAGVIDDKNSWSGAGTHLVITGDLVDRGPESRRVMDLVMRLEQEAPRTGGQVHLLLGNHEVMNIIGDIRYVADEEYAAFSKDESAEEREHWYQRFRQSQPDDADELTMRSLFDEKAPPGFFGHRRAFRYDGIYGEWLLEKPLMIVINDTAFVHGGVPPYAAEHGLAGVNDTLNTDLRKFVYALSALEDAGVLSPVDRFRDQPKLLPEIMDTGQLTPELLTSAQTVLDLRKSPLHGATGPLWYRGSSTCSTLIEADALDAALERIGATRAAIGHTTTLTRQVQQRMDGRILEINTGILKSEYQGSGYALIIEDDDLTVVGEDGASGLLPIDPPTRVGYESETIDDDMLLNILTNGTVIESTTDDTAWQLVQIAADGITVHADFNALPREKGFVPELAAYRLDRMLGLDMVPVTVRREIGGQQGTLQFVPEATMSERDRALSGKGKRAPCSLEKQWGASYVFDVLIHNRARSALALLYSLESWQLILVGHENTFRADRNRPAHLRGVELTMGKQWRSALTELDDEALRKNLGDVLNERRLKALGKRRDALIEGTIR